MTYLRLFRQHLGRRLTAVTTLGAFLMIVVLLSTGMHMMAGGRTCLLDELQNTSCVSMGISEMVTSHTNALNRFISGALILTLLILVALLFVVYTLFAARISVLQRLGISSIPDHGPPPVITQLTVWLSRLIDSPPSLIYGRA